MNASDERYTWIVLSILAGGLLMALVFSLGPVGWAAPGQNPYRQTVPTRTPGFTPTAWVYLPYVAKQYAPGGVAAGGYVSTMPGQPGSYLPLATR